MKRPFCLSLVTFFLVFAPAFSLHAAEREATELLPATTVFYAEVPRPSQVIDLALDHPLRKRLEKLDPYRKALEKPEFAHFKTVLAVVEAQLELKWRPALEALSEGGLYLAVDAETEGGAILLKARDEATLTRIRDTLLGLARDDARRKGKDDPIKTGDYRGITAYKVDKGAFATAGRWLMIVNKPELGKALIDRYLDGGGETLASRPQFQAARKEIAGRPTAWAWLDMQAVRASGKAEKLTEGRTDNPLAELLFGGLIDNLQKTPYVTASAYLTSDELRLTVDAPHNPEWIGKPREYFFGPAGQSAAPPLLEARQTIFSLSVYRNVSQMWLRADDLFTPEMVDRLAQVESKLALFFHSDNFAEDILGAVEPGIQLIVARQDFGDRTPQPAIKLPAGALVVRLRDPEKMQGEMRRKFLSVIGFLNFLGAMNGQPEFDFDFASEGESRIVAARYVPKDDEKTSKEARINFNFSPTVAFRGELMILASSQPLARELLASAAAQAADKEAGREDGARRTNAAIRVSVPVLALVLADNRRQLVSQDMLEQGHTKEEAERDVDHLLQIAEVFRDAGLTLDGSDKQIELELRVRLKPE